MRSGTPAFGFAIGRSRSTFGDARALPRAILCSKKRTSDWLATDGTFSSRPGRAGISWMFPFWDERCVLFLQQRIGSGINQTKRSLGILALKGLHSLALPSTCSPISFDFDEFAVDEEVRTVRRFSAVLQRNQKWLKFISERLAEMFQNTGVVCLPARTHIDSDVGSKPADTSTVAGDTAVQTGSTCAPSEIAISVAEVLIRAVVGFEWFSAFFTDKIQLFSPRTAMKLRAAIRTIFLLASESFSAITAGSHGVIITSCLQIGWRNDFAPIMKGGQGGMGLSHN